MVGSCRILVDATTTLTQGADHMGNTFDPNGPFDDADVITDNLKIFLHCQPLQFPFLAGGAYVVPVLGIPFLDRRPRLVRWLAPA